MKKIFLLLILSCFFFGDLFAAHITGGEMIYEYIGPGATANTARYRITLKLFRDDQTTGAAMPTNVFIGIFDNASLAQYPGAGQYFDVPRASIDFVPVTPPSPCMIDPPTITYSVGTYTVLVDLRDNIAGYTAAYQTCCRINNLFNVFTAPGNNGEGSTYSCNIINNDLHNSSPQFATELTAVCYNSPFTLNFSAIDPNSADSLVYGFCDAFNRGVSVNANNVNPSAPPFTPVTYINGYSGSSPLGPKATIDPKTGIISGIAPADVGQYVVCVCISEYKGGVLVSFHRKDFILTVFDCSIADADLQPKATTCDGTTVNFKNDGSDANVTTWDWEFGEPASGANNFANTPTPQHTYLAAGDYTVKFVVNRNQPCGDSTTLLVKVYPGFDPDFEILGLCANTVIQFNDKTTAAFGAVNNWSWNFGDFSSASNTSTLKNPTHTYLTAAQYDIRFIVSTSVGCIDTLDRKLDILDKPPLELTNDTLICTIDTLQLNAVGTGTFLWTPNYMISSISSPTPLVSPDVATTYHVQLTDAFGCIGKDSVKINVVNFVTQLPPKDTTICRGDAIKLNLVSDALYFVWTPNDGTITGTDIRVPTVTPLVTTTYHVVGSISNKCFAQNNIEVKVVDYPVPNVGPDIPLCLGKSTQLHASGGAYYNWTPALYLSATNIPNPQVVNPRTGVQYIVSVRDTLGCPKSVRDTIYVNVITIHADAGPSDTSVVMGQPLQLNATGGSNYLWNPDTWLTRDDIPNPVSNPQNDIKYVVTVSDANGCVGKDSINVHFYLLDAGIYVPNAFTPNGDGKNDVFRPIELGLKTLDLFRVYNRWGQLLYSTTNISAGWDGKFKGKEQDPAAYIWYAEGTDYKGIKVKKKGSVILIR